MTQQMNHCIGIRYFNKDDINAMLSLAAEIKAGNKVPNLAGARVAHVFFEPSTRTRLSFEMATQRCQAYPDDFRR